MSSRVQWGSLEPGQYEDMVAVLLSHMNPEIRRIDGSGGDEGRDAEFRRPEGPEIFQLKYFTGRMHGSRRRQVKRSLVRAAERNPVAWHLVVPIDPTPNEDRWFEDLGEDYTFPISWEGKTWLDAQMAESPFIPRYFIEGESERVLELLTRLHEEKAALTNIQDGIDRLHGLAEKINEIDPYYRFDLAVRGNDVEIQVIPRYEGAELDRPIGVHFDLAFPETEEGRAAAQQFESAMDFGEPVEVESEYIQRIAIDGVAGLGGEFKAGSGTVKLGPPQPEEDWQLRITLRAVTPDDVPETTIPITLTERTFGRKGLVCRGADDSGALAIDLRAEIDNRRVNVNFKFASTTEHLPQELLPALGFMRAAQPPNRIEILLGDEQIPLGPPVVAPNVPIKPQYIRLVEELARVQRETGTYFKMPPEFSKKDLSELAEAVDLLDGKTVTGRWETGSFEIDVTNPPAFLERLSAEDQEGSAFLVEGQSMALIAGNEVPLGKMRTHLPSARVKNREEVIRALEGAAPNEGLILRVDLEATGDQSLQRSLVPG